MGTRDPRVDAYIEKAQPFAQPILSHLRELIHQACPDVQETIKWSMPHFEYNKAVVCHLAAFKAHCSMGFWKAPLLSDPHKLLTPHGETSMGHFGAIKKLEDLPSDEILAQYISEAARLNKEGVKAPARRKAPVGEKKELETPDYFLEALAANSAAAAQFEQFAPSKKKEYIEWIAGAKTEDTRKKRLDTALEWIAEGKSRHWKYQQN